MASTEIQIGKSWDCIADGKTAVLQWAINNGLSFEVKKANKSKWIAVCRDATICNFRIRISASKKSHTAVLSILIPHTCPAATHYGWLAANSVKVLAFNPLSVAAVVDDRKIRPRQIQTIERLQSGRKVPYFQAYKTREKILKDVHGNEADSFQLIPSMLDAMKGDGNHCEYDLEIDESNRFHRCWIIPQAAINAFKHCRRFVAVDGTHTKVRHSMTLLAMTTLDGNDETLPLAMALVPSESKENWIYFLRPIRRFFPGFSDDDKAVIISDRAKGLKPALNITLPNAAHSFCCQHLADNVGLKWPTCRKRFWNAAYAKTEEHFKVVLDNIRKDSPACAIYIEALSRNRWTRYAFSSPRYGHLTSNIQESMNSQWLEARDMPTAAMLISIWNSLMMKFHSRSIKVHKTNRVTTYASSFLEDEKKEAGRYLAVSSSNNIVMIQAPNGSSHIVNLNERKCTCLDFQDKKLPCRHAIRVCQEYNLELEVYVDKIYSMEAYRSTYEMSMPPIRIEGLSPSLTCLAPLISRKAGRPKKKRQEKKKKKNGRITRCSWCKGVDHNRRNCDQDLQPEVDLRGSDDDFSSFNGFSDDNFDDFSSFNGFSEDDRENVSGIRPFLPTGTASSSDEFSEIEFPIRNQNNRTNLNTPDLDITSNVGDHKESGSKRPLDVVEDTSSSDKSNENTPLAVDTNFEDDVNDSDDDFEDLGSSELRAEWVLSDDPDVAQLTYHIEKTGDFNGVFSGQLARHLRYKERYPKEAAEEMAKHRRTLAMTLDIGQHLTREQWFRAVGEDDIPEPPVYPQFYVFTRRDGTRVSNPFPRPFNQRLQGWALHDPTQADPNNPLRSLNSAEYWKRHDPDCKMSKNPHRLNATTLSLPLLAGTSKQLDPKAINNNSLSSSIENSQRETLLPTKRVRKLTKKGQIWADRDREKPVARTRLAGSKRARAASESEGVKCRKSNTRSQVQTRLERRGLSAED